MSEPTYSIIAFPAYDIPKAYEALVYSKWLRSLRYGNKLFSRTDSDAYYLAYHAYLKSLMENGKSILSLAVLTEDHDVVLGFSVSREHILDYVHVHKDHRNQGIASRLIPKEITTFTHLTKTAERIWDNNPKYQKLIFNPFL